jgi:hypothetical protein
MPRLLCLSIVCLLLFGTIGRAEPIPITAGFVNFTDEPGGVMLTGRGFTLTGGWFPSTVRGTFWYDNCFFYACMPGEVIDFGTTTYGFSASDSSQAISGVIAGTFYKELFLDAELTFSGPRVVAPSELDGSSPRRSGAFTMEGQMVVYQDSGRMGAPVFLANVFGAGTATAFLDLDPSLGPGFQVLDLDYNFRDAAPVPEPATVLLFATGVAMFGGRLARARRG